MAPPGGDGAGHNGGRHGAHARAHGEARARVGDPPVAVPGARPRHPLQNSVGTLRHGVPRESRAPEDAEYTPTRHGVDAVLDPQRKITPPGVSSAREFMGAPRLGKMVAK